MHFLSLTPKALTELMVRWEQPQFRASQVRSWIFERHVASPQEMSNLPQALREKLLTELSWDLPEIVSRLDALDGSSKLLFKTSRGLIESVILRYDDRVSLCVSSQVGCKLSCSFCQTGKLGFVRNLEGFEILAQYYIAQRILKEEKRRLSHVVFMGMGEPLDNYDATCAAVTSLTGEGGFGLSARHVTVSTSGIVPKIESLAQDVRAALAVSLHAARDDLRTELMPINRRYDLASLKSALRNYQATTGNKITIEYILIKDKNCGVREAKELVQFLQGLKAKVNLIPFNAHPGMPYERPTESEIKAFQKYLADRSIAAPVRYSKGLEVSAACGQLAAKKLADLTQVPLRQRVLETPLNP